MNKFSAFKMNGACACVCSLHKLPANLFCMPHKRKHDNKHYITLCVLVCVCVQGLSEIVETTLMFDKSLEKHTNYIIIMTPSCNSDNGDGGGNGHGTH